MHVVLGDNTHHTAVLLRVVVHISRVRLNVPVCVLLVVVMATTTTMRRPTLAVCAELEVEVPQVFLVAVPHDQTAGAL